MTPTEGTHATTASGRYAIAAAALAILLAGTFMPTPLYELYRRVWGLTPAEISLVFAVYAGTLIPALLFLGGMSTASAGGARSSSQSR